jgi:hypothetical protein
MPDARRKHCIRCGGHSDTVGALSWKGYCLPCSLTTNEEASWQIAADAGPIAERRMRGYARWLEERPPARTLPTR